MDDMRVPGLLTPLTTRALTNRPLSRHGGCSGKPSDCLSSVCPSVRVPHKHVLFSSNEATSPSVRVDAPHNRFFMDFAAADQGSCCHAVTRELKLEVYAPLGPEARKGFCPC